MESRSAVQWGSSPNAYTPYDAALSDEPCPTMRTVVAPRSRISAATRSKSSVRSSNLASAIGCSRISARNFEPGSGGTACSAEASADDTVPSVHEDAVDVELVGQDHHVCRQPNGEPSRGWEAEHAGRNRGRGTQRVLERGSDRVEVMDRLDHRERASGELAARAAGHTVDDLDLEPAQPVRAVREAGARHRVGDERDAAGGRPPDNGGSLLREVDAVEDHLDDDVVSRERGAGDPWVAVPEGSHRVEEVRDRAHAGVEGGVRLGGGRVGMPARDRDLVAEERVDERVGARELRGESDEPDGPRGQEALEELPVGISTSVRPVDAEAPRREERPLEMGAQDARPVRAGRQPVERGEQTVFGSGDEGREVRRDARLEQRVTGAAIAVRVGVEEIDAREPVYLKVDEAGHGDAVAVRGREPDAGDSAVVDLDVAADDPAVHECGVNAELHPLTAR